MTWPAALKRNKAAAYVDMSEAAFEREVAKGRLPSGFMLGGKLHWHRAALDKALAVIAGEQTESYENEFWNRGKAA